MSGCPSPDRTRAGQRDTSSASAILTVREASCEADPLAANPIQPPPATRRSFQLARAPGPDRGDGKRFPRAGACSSVAVETALARSRMLTSVALEAKRHALSVDSRPDTDTEGQHGSFRSARLDISD